MPVPNSFDDIHTDPAENSPPGTESAKGVVDNYFRQVFAFIKQNRNFITDLLGTDSSDKAAARSALGVGIGPRVSGLRGNVNAANPLTRFDLSADMVTLRDANGGTVTRYNTGVLTCDFGLAGPAANGRDQSGAFPANSWVNLFLIWNGTTLATIASTMAHTAGPTLPTGYTHWCYATTIRWNAASNIIPMFARGSRSTYNLANNAGGRILTNGAATSATSASYSSFVPPQAITAHLSLIVTISNSTAANFVIYMRNGGATHAGQVVCYLAAYPNVQSGQVNTIEFPVSDSLGIDYYLNQAPTAGGLNIEMLGYTIPNGDA